MNRIKCSFCFNGFTRSLLWQCVWILEPWHEVCHFMCCHKFMWCLQLAVFSPYKMPTHLSVQQRSFISKGIGKPAVMWKPEKVYHSFSTSTYSYQKPGDQVQAGKVWSTWHCKNRHKEACGAQRARDRANIATVRRPLTETLTAPVIWMLYLTVKVCWFVHRRESQNRDFINFQLCCGTAQQSVTSRWYH